MSFLSEPTPSPGQEALYKANLDEDGFVWDMSRLWGHQPSLWGSFRELIGLAARDAGLSDRDKAMLVLGTAATLGDSYCCTAWGRNLTRWADAETTRAVLECDDTPLTERERALVRWARRIAAAPNATTPEDLQTLRDAGFDEPQLVALTLFGSLRLALSITHDALGARPDVALTNTLDPAVRSAITWGRQPA